MIQAGADWRGAIDTRLHQSDIVLLFVSPYFFNSDYCYKTEMRLAMERHAQGIAHVIPIILRPCMWQSAPFSRLQVLPREAKPLTTWENQDAASLNIAEGIMEVVSTFDSGSVKGKGTRADPKPTTGSTTSGQTARPIVDSWERDVPLNRARVWHCAVSDSRRIYVMGGFDRQHDAAVDQRFRSTEWTEVQGDSQLAQWREGPQMAKIRIGASAVLIADFLYVLGGEIGEVGQAHNGPETCFTATIERSQIAKGGSLAEWELIGRMKSERWGFATAGVGQHLYVLGGSDGYTPVATVEHATIADDGSLGAWTADKNLSTPRWALAALHANGFIYVMGGHDGENTLRTVERARVLSDGSLGDWEPVGTMIERRQGATVAFLDSVVYMVGGYSGVGAGDTADNEYLDTAEMATIQGDGELAPWKIASTMKSRRGYHAAAFVGRDLRVIGGGNGQGFVSTVERLRRPPTDSSNFNTLGS
jgi:hypothetical protein